MELGTRTGSKRLIKGLAKAIEQDARLSAAEIKSWKEVKGSGKRLFVPDLGGNFAVFDQRRLSAEIFKYSVQDVLHIPALRRTYLDQLGPVWKAKVEEEGFGRIALSQSAGFNGRGRDMAEGLEAWQKKKKSRDFVGRRNVVNARCWLGVSKTNNTESE